MKITHLFKFSIFSFFLLLILQSCVSKKNIIYLQDKDTIDISEITSTQNSLQENDIISIDITSLEMSASIPYNKTSVVNTGVSSLELLQLNGYLVSDNKTISFPVLGEISVAGKTAQDLEVALKQQLESEGHLIKPNVTVRLLNAKVTILGEVNLPGTYTFTEKNISFLQAIGLAGDLTIDGNRKDLTLIRQIEGKRVVTNLDLTSAKWLVGPYQNIQPNDVIIVNPNSKKVKSAGLIGNINSVLSIASILLSTIILTR